MVHNLMVADEEDKEEPTIMNDPITIKYVKKYICDNEQHEIKEQLDRIGDIFKDSDSLQDQIKQMAVLSPS